MTQANSKDFLPLIEAWSRGETLQIKNQGRDWYDLEGDVGFGSLPEHYRIKPKPLELWVNIFPGGPQSVWFVREEDARHAANTWPSKDKPRTVHMREVTT